MPDWSERLESARLPDALSNLREAVEGAERRAEGAGEEQVPVRRAAAATDLVEALLASEASDVVGQGTLSDLTTRLDALQEPLQTWAKGSRKKSLLNDVGDGVDELLDVLARFPQPAPADAATAAWAVVKKVRGAGTRAQNVFAEEVEQAAAEIAALRTRIEEADGERDAHLEQAKGELGERLDALKADLDRLRDDMASTTETFEERESAATKQRAKDFDDAEGARAEEFRSLQKQREEEWAQQSDAFDERFTTKFNSVSETAETEVERIENLRIYVEEVSGLVGDTALAGEYAHQADQQQESADRWRLVTIALLLGAAGWALLAVFFGGLSTPDTSDYLGRLPLAVLLVVLAAYTGRQSTLHRRREHAYRQRQMQLQALRLYLAPLDDAQQAAVMMQLSPRFFGDGDDDGNVDDARVHDVDGLAKLLAETTRTASNDDPSDDTADDADDAADTDEPSSDDD